MPPARTMIRDMAPWVILALVSVLGVGAKWIGSDPAVFQLLSGVAGICGGAVVARRPEQAPTTTVTAGDPPTVTTGPTP